MLQDFFSSNNNDDIEDTWQNVYIGTHEITKIQDLKGYEIDSIGKKDDFVINASGKKIN